MPSATRMEEFTGECPHCRARFEGLLLPVTVMGQAYTAPALAAFRGAGHLVVLTGRNWLVRCGEDSKDALKHAATLVPVTQPRQVAMPLSAHTDEVVGGRRKR